MRPAVLVLACLATAAHAQPTPTPVPTPAPALRTIPATLGKVGAVTFTPDGRFLIAADVRSVRQWDIAAGMLFPVNRGSFSWIQSLAVSPNGRHLAAGLDDGSTVVWQLEGNRPLRRFGRRRAWVRQLAFSPDGNTLLTGLRNGEHAAYRWDFARGRALHRFPGEHDDVAAVAFSPDGRLVATGGDDIIRLYDAESGRLVRRCDGDKIFYIVAVHFTPDSRSLVAVGHVGPIRVLDVATCAVRQVPTEHTRGTVEAMVLSPDGRLAVTAVSTEREPALVHDLATGQVVARLAGHLDAIQSLAFSPDGRLVATGSYDHTARLWDAATGQELVRIGEPRSPE